MFEKLAKIEEKFRELEERLTDTDLIKNRQEYQKVLKERAELKDLVDAYSEYKEIVKQIEEAGELLGESDSEIKKLASQELKALELKKSKIEGKIKILLLPKDPYEGKDIFLEIRSGTGGDEASLFAADLFRMYLKFAERNRWKVELVTSNQTGVRGFKEVIAQIRGKDVYKRMKYESGVHRVQRVPKTEAQGRIHTSAVTVAILPEAEDIDVDIQDKDLRVDVFRSSGPGGQSVNTTDSAVRITHIPSGLVVTCQDEKSQHKNKAKAMSVLRARLFEAKRREQEEKIARERKSQVKSGDRSDKIRTYNFPQGRVTDHRVGMSFHNIQEIMDGRLDELIANLTAHFQTLALQDTDI